MIHAIPHYTTLPEFVGFTNFSFKKQFVSLRFKGLWAPHVVTSSFFVGNTFTKKFQGSGHVIICWHALRGSKDSYPSHSMYDLLKFTYNSVILGVNIGKYTIHWVSGYGKQNLPGNSAFSCPFWGLVSVKTWPLHSKVAKVTSNHHQKGHMCHGQKSLYWGWETSLL